MTLPLVDEAELIVVGAGPAGSVCAAVAAERGLDVLLIDQDDFPREKACGDGLKRSAVALLHELGLDRLVDSSLAIEGARFVLDHGRGRCVRFPVRGDRPRLGMCVPRSTLDHAIRDAALARGARFLKASVDGPLGKDTGAGGSIQGVSLRGRSGGEVRGRVVVAADGATSRLRRQCGLRTAGGPVGYALRGYFCCEHDLDPLFEIHVPLIVNGAVLPGYGWVFPVGERLANIGVGLMRGTGLERLPSLRVVLDSFVEALRSRSAARLGELRPTTPVLGSPIPLGFTAERCELSGAFFAGDAAHAVDPLSGEGIAYAMSTGATIAAAATARLRGARARGAVTPVGVTLAREFPRMVQDPTLVARIFVRTLSRRYDPALARLERFDSEERTALADMLRPMTLTPSRGTGRFMSFLAGTGSDTREVLDSWARQLLDLVYTRFPVAYELLQHELRASSGVTVAATALLSAQAIAKTTDWNASELRRVGIAAELMRLAHRLLSRVPGRETTNHQHLRSGFTVLIGDFCLTRWMTLIAPGSQHARLALIEANSLMCEAQLAEQERRFDTDLTPERYVAHASASANAMIFATAARLGGELAGACQVDVQALERCGRELGIAHTIAEDVVELLSPERVDVTDARWRLRTGFLGLPTLHALRQRPVLRKLIRPGMSDADSRRALAEIRAGDGAARAQRECRRHVLAARAALATIGGDRAGNGNGRERDHRELFHFASYASDWIKRESSALAS